MKLKILVLAAILCLFSWSCPEKNMKERLPKAVIRITVDSTPILMEWDWLTGLWYMTPYVSATETAGVGVNVTHGRLEFIYQNQAGYEPQEMAGGRLNAYQSLTFHLSVGTEYGYDKVRFSVFGTDDNGHNITAKAEFNLFYVN